MARHMSMHLSVLQVCAHVYTHLCDPSRHISVQISLRHVYGRCKHACAHTLTHSTARRGAARHRTSAASPDRSSNTSMSSSRYSSILFQYSTTCGFDRAVPPHATLCSAVQCRAMLRHVVHGLCRKLRCPFFKKRPCRRPCTVGSPPTPAITT